MLGFELRDAELTQNVVDCCFRKDIILCWTLHSNSLVRIAPPLIIEEKLLEQCFQTIPDGVDKHRCMVSPVGPVNAFVISDLTLPDE